MILVPAVGTYCLVLAIFPKPLLNLIYGPEYAAATVLRLYTLSAFLAYMQMVIVAALTAARQTRQIFIGNIIGCVLALVLAPVCIKLWGAPGAIINMIVTTLIVTIMFGRAYLQQNRKGFAVVTSQEEPK
jgi:O-antigen/teichoic acid export membrane protein